MRFLQALITAYVVADSIVCGHAFVSPMVIPASNQCSSYNRPNNAPTTRMNMIDPSAAAAASVSVDWSVSASVFLAETEVWVQPAQLVLDPFLNLMSFAMLARVVLSWYPETKLNDFPWVLLVFPTEPLLRIVKGVVPPAFGVDITPVFWLAIFTFVHEILLGQQGLLTMKIKYGI